MTPQMKSLLEQMVNAIVAQKNEDASAAFHEYLRLKSQMILVGEGSDEMVDDLPPEEDDVPAEGEDGDPTEDGEGSDADDVPAEGGDDDSCAKM